MIRSWASLTIPNGGTGYTVNVNGNPTSAASVAVTYNQLHTWSVFLNQSGSAQSFLGPDGITHYTLNDNSFSVFEDNTLVKQNISKSANTGPGGALDGIAFFSGRNYSGANSKTDLDNIVIRNDLGLYTSVPEPASLSILALGGLLMMRRRRA